MKILVLSDTHVPVMTDSIPEAVLRAAEGCDLCLHAGDFVDYSVYETLSSKIKTIGVCGNMDNPTVRKNLPEKQVIPVEDIVIGLTHGRGAPEALMNYVRGIFKAEWDSIDIFVFGHSHNPLDKVVEGKRFFNPGSCTDTVFAPYNSYGIIEVKGKEISSRIIKID